MKGGVGGEMIWNGCYGVYDYWFVYVVFCCVDVVIGIDGVLLIEEGEEGFCVGEVCFGV